MSLYVSVALFFNFPYWDDHVACVFIYLFGGGEAFLGRNKNTYCGHWNIYTGGNVSVIFIEQRGMYIGEGEICLCGVNEG